ncbi:aminoglycoside phosphotransferase family protein [Lysinibacillus sp. RS11]|uniref:aminoglycoside phosphotransferase family protein n=1 Tax=Lysinibacillus sp. RS11 TaxID=3242682 RepID=UPI0035C7423B
MLEKIDKGYSPDEKYIVTIGQTKYFIRLSDMKYHEKRKIEFSLLRELEKQGVQTHKAIEYKRDANLSVMLLSYIEGTPADEIIKNLSDMEKFTIGFAAGKELRKIHQLQAPHPMNREAEQRKKFNYYLSEYQKVRFKIPQEQKILDYINHNFHLLKDRPVTLLHDDFHLGHIIIFNRDFNGVIDFNGLILEIPIMIFIIFPCLAEDLVFLIGLDKLMVISQRHLMILFGGYSPYMQP